MRNRLLAILRLEAGMWVRALIRMAGRLARCSYTLGVHIYFILLSSLISTSCYHIDDQQEGMHVIISQSFALARSRSDIIRIII